MLNDTGGLLALMLRQPGAFGHLLLVWGRKQIMGALATLDRCRQAALPSFAGIDPVHDDTIASKP
jgi:hypothetical protein